MDHCRSSGGYRRSPCRKLPAGMQRTLEGAAEALIDWREMLRRVWSETTPATTTGLDRIASKSGPATISSG